MSLQKFLFDEADNFAEDGFNIHEKKDEVTGILKPDNQGKPGNYHRVREEQKAEVFAGTNSFRFIDSNYCRAKTNKKCLEAGSNIEKLYDLYKENAKKKNSTVNLRNSAVFSTHRLRLISISQKLIDVKSVRELKLKKMKIYRLRTKKSTFTIYT